MTGPRTEVLPNRPNRIAIVGDAPGRILHPATAVRPTKRALLTSVDRIQRGTSELDATPNPIGVHLACLDFSEYILGAFKESLFYIFASFSTRLQKHKL